jgi:hypothetical protein
MASTITTARRTQPHGDEPDDDVLVAVVVVDTGCVLVVVLGCVVDVVVAGALVVVGGDVVVVVVGGAVVVVVLVEEVPVPVFWAAAPRARIPSRSGVAVATTKRVASLDPRTFTGSSLGKSRASRGDRWPSSRSRF